MFTAGRSIGSCPLNNSVFIPCYSIFAVLTHLTTRVSSTSQICSPFSIHIFKRTRNESTVCILHARCGKFALNIIQSISLIDQIAQSIEQCPWQTSAMQTLRICAVDSREFEWESRKCSQTSWPECADGGDASLINRQRAQLRIYHIIAMCICTRRRRMR